MVGYRPGSRSGTSGVHTGFGDDRLMVGAYKVVTDGSTSGPTGATREPYTSNSDDSGILYYSQTELDGMLLAAHRAGFQVTMHAVGDRAIESGLDGLAAAQAVSLARTCGTGSSIAPSVRRTCSAASARRASCQRCSRRSSGSSAMATS